VRVLRFLFVPVLHFFSSFPTRVCSTNGPISQGRSFPICSGMCADLCLSPVRSLWPLSLSGVCASSSLWRLSCHAPNSVYTACSDTCRVFLSFDGCGAEPVLCSGFLCSEGYWGVVQRALDGVVRWCCYREYCGIFEICMDMLVNLCAERPGAYLDRLWLSGVNLSWGRDLVLFLDWAG